MARSKLATYNSQLTTSNKKEEKVPEKKRVELKTYTPREAPMKLSQLQYIAPKKFERRKKPEVNLEEVRKLINETKTGN